MKPTPRPALNRSIVFYALMLAGLPALQGAAFLTGGWTESVSLLILYFALPLGAVWLTAHRQARFGAILLLGFMSSGIVINSILFASLEPPPFASSIWVFLLHAWIIVMIVTQVVIGWLAFRVLQEVHQQSLPTKPPAQG
jgi:hypothetical protein